MVAHEIGTAERVAERQANRGAGWADMLERSRRRQTECLAKLAHELPRIESVEQIDVPRRTIEDFEWQPPARPDPGGYLVGVDPVPEQKLSPAHRRSATPDSGHVTLRMAYRLSTGASPRPPLRGSLAKFLFSFPVKSRWSERGPEHCGAYLPALKKRGVAAGRSAQRACERSSDWRRGAAGSPDPYGFSVDSAARR